jgi:hypothetical protein
MKKRKEKQIMDKVHRLKKESEKAHTYEDQEKAPSYQQKGGHIVHDKL